MRLLGTLGSPFVRKVRIVLAEKGIAYEYVIDRPSAPESRVPSFNPLGKIPVLVRDDGRPLYDSPVIVEYVDVLGAAPKLIPDPFSDRIEVKRWEALGDGVVDAAVLLSHEYRKPDGSMVNAEGYAKQRQKIERALVLVSQDLGEREFCYGARFTLADIAVGYALGYLDVVLREFDWRSAHPNLERFAARLAARESFRVSLPPTA